MKSLSGHLVSRPLLPLRGFLVIESVLLFHSCVFDSILQSAETGTGHIQQVGNYFPIIPACLHVTGDSFGQGQGDQEAEDMGWAPVPTWLGQPGC